MKRASFLGVSSKRSCRSSQNHSASSTLLVRAQTWIKSLESQKQPECSLKNDRMISVHFQWKPFNITVIQVYAPTSNAEEAEVEWFFEDLQDLLELTPQKDVLFITGDWNAKVGSQ